VSHAPAPNAAAGRHDEVVRVLRRVLVFNLLVSSAKLALGYVTGAVSVISDGFHSLSDGLSNVVALVGVHIGRKPPDAEHPYGHHKYETMAAAAIAVLLLLAMIEIGETAWNRLGSASTVEATPLAFGVMIATIAGNVAVTLYERRAGRRLGSQVLLADALHTQSDVLTSLAVIIALVGARLGYPLLDPIAAFVIIGFIGHAVWEIVRSTSNVLGDRVQIAEEDIRDAVMSVPHVMGCHEIRTRGTADHVFVDLHIWMEAGTRLDAAHEISHEVKDRLMARFPQIGDAIIHIEPPPRLDDPRHPRHSRN